MKFRSMAVAVLLASAPIAVATVARDASAAPKEAAPPSDPIVELARQKFQEGVKLFDARKYEEARVAFTQSYALKKHPLTLYNLAQSELKSNHAMESIRHLQQYQNENPDLKPDDRSNADKLLVEARTKVGRLQVAVNINGADILVDDAIAGHSPLAQPIDVEPGARKIEVRAQGYASVAMQVSAVAGQVTPIGLSLAAGNSTAPAAIVPIAAAPVAAAQLPVAQPMPSNVEPVAPSPAATPEQPSGPRKPFFKWVKDDKIAWVELGVTGVGIVVGAVFTGIMAAQSNTVNSHADQISAKAASDPNLSNYNGSNRSANPCASPVPDTSGKPGGTNYLSACTTLSNDKSTYTNDRTGMIIGWSVAGAGVIATVVTYYLRSKPKKAAVAFDPTHEIVFTPLIGPVNGFGLSGQF